jgi:small subunit ribosomal protein S8
MMTDPIADMLTRIRNGVAVSMPSVDVPYSRLKHDVCKALVDEGFLVQFEVIDGEPRKNLRIQLRYGNDGEKAIQSLKRVSKPGRRVYLGVDELKPVLGGMGARVLSTSRGVMSDRAARVQRIGGEVICEIY